MTSFSPVEPIAFPVCWVLGWLLDFLVPSIVTVFRPSLVAQAGLCLEEELHRPTGGISESELAPRYPGSWRATHVFVFLFRESQVLIQIQIVAYTAIARRMV